jgi:hypothetical protein
MDDLPARWKKILLASLGVAAAATLGAAAWLLTRPGGIPHALWVMSGHGGELGARGRETMVQSDLRSIATVTRAYQVEVGRWPASIAELVRPTGPDGSTLLVGLDSLPRDPWGHGYRYEIVDGAPRLTCLGSDGAEGGSGEAADRSLPVDPADPH